MTAVVVYSRPGCHLCEEAIEAIVALHAEGYRFELREVDIESDEAAAALPPGANPGGRGRRRGRLRAAPRRNRPAGEARYCGGMVEVIEEVGAPSAFPVEGERLSLGVAARLSRYLQVLTQARKMGRETISSQELSEYTHINPTQIRRDLSGFGKFGKRGVGYNVDSLVAEIRKILRTSGQHNIALFGAGNLGQAIASSDIFADHGFQIVAMFDVDPGVVGTEVGDLAVRDFGELEAVVSEEEIVVGVLAVPPSAAQDVADRLVEAGVKIIFNYSEQLLQVPPEVTVHTSSPGRRPALRALLLPGLSPCPWTSTSFERDSSPRPTSRSGSRRSSRSSTRRRWSWSTASRTSTPPARRTRCWPSRRPAS